MRDRGLSLIELTIAVFVLAIGTLAAVQLLDQAGRTIGGEAGRFLALNQAQNRIAEIRLIGVAGARGLPGLVAEGPYDWTIEVDEAATASGLVEVTVRATADDGPGAVLVGYVPVEPPR